MCFRGLSLTLARVPELGCLSPFSLLLEKGRGWHVALHLQRVEAALYDTGAAVYTLQTWCLSVCVFDTDIHGLRPGQPLRGAGRGATAFYTSIVDA